MRPFMANNPARSNAAIGDNFRTKSLSRESSSQSLSSSSQHDDDVSSGSLVVLVARLSSSDCNLSSLQDGLIGAVERVERLHIEDGTLDRDSSESAFENEALLEDVIGSRLSLTGAPLSTSPVVMTSPVAMLASSDSLSLSILSVEHVPDVRSSVELQN